MSPLIFWIVFATKEDNRRLSFGSSHFSEGPLKGLDKWTEVLGPRMVVDWVRIFNVPLHAWRKEVMWKLGEMCGAVEEIDARCLSMEVVEFVRMKVVRLATKEIPKKIVFGCGIYSFWLVDGG